MEVIYRRWGEELGWNDIFNIGSIKHGLARWGSLGVDRGCEKSSSGNVLYYFGLHADGWSRVTLEK